MNNKDLMKAETTYRLVIVKLDHRNWEKDVNKIICDQVDDSIFVYAESTRVPKCHEGFAYEDPMIKRLQWADSFFVANRAPEELARLMSRGHVGGKERMEGLNEDLPTSFFLVGLGGPVLVPADLDFREAFREAAGTGDSKEYGRYAEISSRWTPSTFINRVRQWRRNPSVLDDLVAQEKEAVGTFSRWLESTGKYPFDFNEWRSIINDIAPGNPDNVRLSINSRHMVVDLRDNATVQMIRETAKAGRYKKFVMLVGSGHAQGIRNRLDDPGWDITIVEKHDTEQFTEQMLRLRDERFAKIWEVQGKRTFYDVFQLL